MSEVNHSAASVIGRNSAWIMAVDGVLAVFEGATDTGEPCIRVLTSESPEETARHIPRTLEGIPVVIEESDPIRPLSE